MSYGLYIHIPFCKSICSYCDFCKMVVLKKEIVANYIKRLILEFDMYEKYLKDIKTIYIGGGTPNFLDNDNLELLLKKISLYNKNTSEFSIEINPELLTLDQIKLFKKYGINRVSIGAEAFDDEILKKLGRGHSVKDILNAVKMLKDNGILNINLDVIYAHPWDNKELIDKTIKYIKELDVAHLSFYTLILEDKTVFKYKNIKMLDEDLISDLMDYLNNNLDNYNHYEISNYAKEGFESIHNKIYWQSEEYIGLGMGASGYLDSIRYDNCRTMKEYLLNFKSTENRLDLSDKKSEYLILGLRLLEGVSIKEYEKRFNSIIFDDFNFEKLLKYNLIEINDDKIKLTYKGYKLGNVVFEEFI